MPATTTHNPKEGAMLATINTIESEMLCRQMAVQHPTPNVLRGVALAEQGRVSWAKLAEVFADALAAGLAAVK